MGSVGNLAIWQVLPQMGAIYDSYTVQALVTESPELAKKKVSTDQHKSIPLVKEEEIKSWLPPEVRERIYPAGAKKLNPEAVNVVAKQAKGGSREAEQTEKFIQEAEKSGAAWAFRWVAVLPCVLVVIFGLIAIIDKLRGGYKAVHIHDAGPPSGDGHARGPAVHAGPGAFQKAPGIKK